MAARVFTAPDGTLWQAWNVVPGQHADWPSHARNHLPEGMAAGWLCFESATEKRRLHPIPSGWESPTDADLWHWCVIADPVRARRTEAAAPAPSPAASQAAAAR